MDISKANQLLAGATPEQVVEWGIDTFSPLIAMSSSFQTQSVPLLHIASRVAPNLPIIFLDTGYHFPETLAFRDHLREAWKLNIQVERAAAQPNRLPQRTDPELYRQNPNLCCYINKVEPMERAIEGLRAWISGIRRDQTTERKRVRIVERMNQGRIRLHPMVSWTRSDIRAYSRKYDLPEHPLSEHGYGSIGCAPCTRPVGASDSDFRSGRWAGTDKLECGLHTSLRGSSNQTQPDLVRIEPER